ncbi:phage holin, LLH family [Heyndrickxia coagulans]|uniref:phage holin, LLH family n=1 Tax=Heyndrickxia coagulans TaxID=1398 RepID=UPI002E1F3F6E|nr:phage holin, LLH family [Heyndrickxia coagulans]
MLHTIIQAVYAIILAAIPAVLGYAGRYAKKFLQSKHLEGIAIRAVKYAEQLLPAAGEGNAKYRAASQYLAKKAYQLFKINLEPDDIQALIEAAVADLNKEMAAFADAPAKEAVEDEEPAEETEQAGEETASTDEQVLGAIDASNVNITAKNVVTKEVKKVGDMTLEELRAALANK